MRVIEWRDRVGVGSDSHEMYDFYKLVAGKTRRRQEGGGSGSDGLKGAEGPQLQLSEGVEGKRGTRQGA